jgi:hypothetical protein
MGKGDRPEHSAPPELFYDGVEAEKYTTSSRVMEIQEKLTMRALELLALEDDGTPKMILDVGCGSGLSGQVLTEQGARVRHCIRRHGFQADQACFDAADQYLCCECLIISTRPFGTMFHSIALLPLRCGIVHHHTARTSRHTHTQTT